MTLLISLSFIGAIILLVFPTVLFDNNLFTPSEAHENFTGSITFLIEKNSGNSNFEIIPNIVNITTNWIADYGYVGVFTAALVENLFPPIPSELIFPLAGITAFTKNLGFFEGVMGMSLAGAAGSTVGALIIYYISRRIGKAAVLKIGNRIGIGEEDLEKAEKWFEKHGQAAVFFGRMAPGVRELISIPAGIEKMKPSAFIVFTFAGSLVWCTFLTTIGFFLGEIWNRLYKEYAFVLDFVAVIIIVAIIAVVLYRHYKNKKKRKNERKT